MTIAWQTNWSFQLEQTAEQMGAMKRHKERYPINNEACLRRWMKELDTEDLINYLVFIPCRELDVLKKLGNGGFAETFLASIKGTGDGARPIVLKIFNNSTKDMIRNELRLNIHLQYYRYHHPSATRWAATPHLIGISETDNKRLALIMQYAAGGNLEQYLHRSPPTSWATIYRIAMGIVRRLQAIHEAGVVHLDFHPGNIVFINESSTTEPNPLIIDVGISMMIKDLHETSQSAYGRIEYLPPEIFSRNSKPHSKAHDIYSLGTVLWQLTSGRAPIGTANARPKAADGACLPPSLREIPILGTPDAFEELYKLCWNPNPDKRPTVNEIISRLEAAQRKIESAKWHGISDFVADSRNSSGQTFSSRYSHESMSSSPSRFIGHEELFQKVDDEDFDRVVLSSTSEESIEQIILDDGVLVSGNTLTESQVTCSSAREFCKRVNAKNKHRTPHHFAAISEHFKSMRLLLASFRKNAHANPNINDGWTPLHSATMGGHVEIIKLLVTEFEADVNVKDIHDGWTPLHLAAGSGRVEVVQVLVNELGADVNVIANDGKSPLHFAAESGHIEVVKLLVAELGVNINPYDFNRRTPLHFAAESGRVEVMRLLVSELGADAEAKAKDGKTPLHLAAGSGHVEIVKLLVNELGADVNVVTNDRRSPLHFAAESGHLVVVRLLVAELGANINPCDFNRRTPLHFATESGHIEVVRLLVSELGADAEAKAKNGKTSLHFAVESGHIEIVRLFVEFGADVKVRAEDGKKPLHFAVERGHVEVLRTKLGADINGWGFNRWTLLHLAALSGRVEVVRLLVSELGADAEAKTRDGKTPLHLAAERGHFEVVRLLVSELGADTEAKAKDGKTPLHFAAERGHVEVVRLLVSELSADINAKDMNGRTLLYRATESGHIEVIRLLVIELKADVNGENLYDGKMVLHLVAMSGRVDLVRLLVTELGADVNVKDKGGAVPLHLAAENGHIEVVRLLMTELGADFNVKDGRGMAPLDWAKKYQRNEVVEFLENLVK